MELAPLLRPQPSPLTCSEGFRAATPCPLSWSSYGAPHEGYHVFSFRLRGGPGGDRLPGSLASWGIFGAGTGAACLGDLDWGVVCMIEGGDMKVGEAWGNREKWAAYGWPRATAYIYLGLNPERVCVEAERKLIHIIH
ncbi:hypothetical protein WMY93_024900 [Mugilogobius chulae]|uniref:Uncharacterized protein n=1 Tax=Mugilogobius chulae TaxID=88201 RepID=A0AAW0NBE0_9GOBI